ncbi:MAG TPA: glucose-6-phosphate dehydrogenase [Longimicrobium sp.]|jgi:glucose-6-phosphate 1-dehydrogenase|uniref:glucose-6-phosphate dehydrogenase n=1 Tax=Longimicrobium sp. TaxID=2029185 RepID=UPI002EDAE7CB
MSDDPQLPEVPLPPATGETPLRTPMASPMARVRCPDPLVLVIFGGTGDLARRKLMPALWKLKADGLLPDEFAIVGNSREDIDETAFRERMRGALEEFAEAPDAAEWEAFAKHIYYVHGSTDNPQTFQDLRACLEAADAEHGTRGNRLYYLALPPSVIAQTSEGLGRAGLVCEPEGECWSRIIVEKPFGRDLKSARELNAALLRVFSEPQVFRIDHYLGKETLQNLLIFRFANIIWEPLWSRTYVDHVQITVSESVGVEGRAGYYDTSGALRDMVQSHLLQILTLVAMEPPASYDADSIRNEKVKVLQSIPLIQGDDIARYAVRGQYAASGEGDGAMPGYLDEEKVPEGSRTETFAAVRLTVDNWRWAGVPFYLRTGKRLPAKASEVVIRFRPAPHPVRDLVQVDDPAPNALVLHIQPDEGISLFFEAKQPGLRGELRPVSMDFDYCKAFKTESPEAYQRLLLDAMLGDATLFARRDEVEAAWTLVTPLAEAWEAAGQPEPYPANSWGPRGADEMLAREGRTWAVPGTLGAVPAGGGGG